MRWRELIHGDLSAALEVLHGSRTKGTCMLHYKGQEDMGGNIPIPCMLSTLSTMSSY